MADIEPPQEPPTKIAINSPIAATGGRPIATGRSRMIPISGPSPGSAPTRRPNMTPISVSPIASGVENSSNPVVRDSASMVVYHGMLRPNMPPGNTILRKTSNRNANTNEMPAETMMTSSGLRRPLKIMKAAIIGGVERW